MIRPLVLATLVVATPAAAEEFSLPLRCVPGDTCTVQNYVDADGSADRADYRCGAMTYDGHDGTDVRVPPGADVEVLAAADGVVRATRDGEADRAFDGPPPTVDPQRACGNAVVMDHADGSSTMYCHMKRGSVRVAAGDRVARGDPIGLVGASGQTEFRHVHLGVRVDGAWRDPFTGREAGAGCGKEGTPLWTAEAAAALEAGGRTEALAVGFDDRAVTTGRIEDAATATPTAQSPALVAWGLVTGTEEGDVVRLVLDGPGGPVRSEEAEPRARAQAMRFVGRSRPPAPGTYTATVSVLRGGTVLSERSATLTVR